MTLQSDIPPPQPIRARWAEPVQTRTADSAASKKPQKCCLFAFSVFISVHLLPGFSLTWLCPSPPSATSSSSSSGHGGDLRGSATLCDQTNQDASEPPRATGGRTSELVLEQRSRPSSPLLPLLLALSILTPFSAAAAFAVRVRRL